MSQIFENFLKNFYFREQDTFAVASENLHWDVTSPSISDLTMIPIMKTDVTLRNRSKIIIIDAKFYSEPFAQSFGIQKLRSSHLYQLYAYLKQTAKDTPSASVQGMLMYAANSAGSRKHYEIDGHSITIVTLDLNRPWPLIHCELLDLIVGDTTATVARL